MKLYIIIVFKIGIILYSPMKLYKLPLNVFGPMRTEYNELKRIVVKRTFAST